MSNHFPCFLALIIAIGLLPLQSSPAQEFTYPADCQSIENPAGCDCLADVMNTRQHRLRDYRRIFRTGTTPCPEDLVGTWRGVNKGIVELAGYRQFIKEIGPCGECVFGDNIMVEQVDPCMLDAMGWQPKITETGELDRKGKFAVLPPRGVGAFKHGVVFSYRQGGNRRTDPVKLLVDKVVKLDDDHLLGRATANFGPLQIPLAYFVLERVH